ncbi:MAG TPA: dipeptidase [Solirubrobacteraceae bacterium]
MRIIDGHNDALLRAYEAGDDGSGLLRAGEGAVDLPAARVGGLAAGLFAVFSPSPGEERVDVPPPLPWADAAPVAAGVAARAFALVRASAGAVRLVRDADDLAACVAGEAFGLVLHIEGAEAIDPGLEALDLWHAAGLRSLGPVWSRPNAFGEGVPFAFPSSPDTGGGLTEAGTALVRGCARLGIAVDLSHINEAGFWDAAKALDGRPLIASHSGAHALCQASRNLTDRQLRAIGASGGLVGIVFACPFLRADGANDADTPLSRIVEHARYAADLIGVEHVALGSDFDGATMPAALRTARELPALVDALRDGGFTEAELELICHGNWQRVLAAAWST